MQAMLFFKITIKTSNYLRHYKMEQLLQIVQVHPRKQFLRRDCSQNQQ